VNEGGGSFTYRPDEVGSGVDDSFTYGWSYGGNYHIGLVTIIVGLPDKGVSAANIMSSAEQSAPELDEVLEKILPLLEEAVAQEEGLEEGVDLGVEAAVEGIEVLIDYADDYDIQALSEPLSQLMQEVKDGNLDAVPETITALASDLADAPPEVSIAVLLKMAPRLIDAHAALSDGSVSPDTIAEAQQALEQLDPDYPGKAEALQFFQEGVDIIEVQNNAIEDSTEVLCTIIGMIITELESAGEEGWAEQFAADSEACGY
jgi:hypothetical protein